MALRSILVPIDGSPASLAALDHAITLAADYGAKLDVLHVTPSDGILLTSPDGDGERVIADAVDCAREALGGNVSYRTHAGEPTREIVAAGREVDLIVMGTHGRVGRLHELLGSVAEGVVRNASCPVMTVRDPSGGYQSFAEYRHGRPTISEGLST